MNLKKVKIKSKKSVGVLPVYDICVPISHHYLLDSGIVSHNSGFIYASSIVVAMKRLKLKEDEDGNKTSEVLGIRAGCKIMKTRYSKPFETIQIKIPYSTGMNPYSGMFDMIESKGLVNKEGNRYTYVDNNGEIHKYYRKEWEKNENGCLDLVMAEYHSRPQAMANNETVEESTDQS